MPKDLILGSNEHLILTTRPLFLWAPLVLLALLIAVAAPYVAGLGAP